MRAVPALPGAFWRGWTVMAMGRLAQFVEPFLPVLLLVQFGAGATAAAGVLLAAQLASTAGSAAAGAAMDRWGRRRVLRVGLSAAGVSCGALALAPHLGVAAVAAVVYGVASTSWRGAAGAVVPAVLAGSGVPASTRTVAFGLLIWASNLGAVASASVGATGAPVHLLIAAQGGLLVLTAVLARILPDDNTHRGDHGGTGDDGRDPATVTPRPARVPDAGLWLLALAVAPATALMFQAFSGLAILLPPADYRLMVLVNALVLVAGQPLVAWTARRVPAGPLLAVAGLGLAAGLALHAVGMPVLVATPVWTLAELVVIVVPSAVVAGIAPHRRTGTYIGTFQAVQGGAAAAASFAGPVAAAASPLVFALGCLLLAALGGVALLALRRLVQTGLDQPVDCSCGAVLCRCGGIDMTCVGPAPLILHAARTLHR